MERAEQRADALTRLDFTRRGDGSTHIAATVPDAVAARLKTYLEAFTSPRHHNSRDDEHRPRHDPATGVRLPADRHRGLAFCALLERLDPRRLPDHGGLATTMMVTIPLETLTTGLGTAQLGTGETITAGDARRLACTAGLVPAVLGTRSEVLDLGRTARLFTPAQRKALALRHPHCRAEDCDVPHPGPRPTTPPPGPTAARPTSPTASCSATGTTNAPTTPATPPPAPPTATSAPPKDVSGGHAGVPCFETGLRPSSTSGTCTPPGG